MGPAKKGSTSFCQNECGFVVIWNSPCYLFDSPSSLENSFRIPPGLSEVMFQWTADLVFAPDNRAHDARSAAVQSRPDSVEETAGSVGLAGIPDHDTAEAGEALGVLDNGSKAGGGLEAGAGRSRAARSTDVDLHIRVLGDVLGPVVPGLEVEVRLRGGAGSERLQTAVVVVELHPDGVKGNGAVEHGVVRSIGVGALRRGSQVVLLGRVLVHQRAELVAKGRHVGHRGLEVEIEAINHSVAKRTVDRRVGSHGSKGLPDHVRAGNGGFLTGETTFAVGGASDGEEDSLSQRLARLDVLSDFPTLVNNDHSPLQCRLQICYSRDLWAVVKLSAREVRAVVAGVRKVDHWSTTRAIDLVQEGEWEDLLRMSNLIGCAQWDDRTSMSVSVHQQRSR